MTDRETKIEQCKQDIETLQANLAELKQEPKWIAAVAEDRLILNLAALSTKRHLRQAIENNVQWISFHNSGDLGTTDNKKNGLTFYRDTKIIFGGNNDCQR